MKPLPLLSLLRRLCRRPAAPLAPTALPAAAEEAHAVDEAPGGCGWFDSSHDLQHGLRVQEHLSPESLARELPLGAWLELQLGHWRAAAPASPPFTHAT
jgi:hypothetical protein